MSSQLCSMSRLALIVLMSLGHLSSVVCQADQTGSHCVDVPARLQILTREEMHTTGVYNCVSSMRTHITGVDSKCIT